MILSKKMEEKAQQTLQYEGLAGLPKEIQNTGFFVAKSDDRTIIAHGAIEFEGVEFKIGTKK